jgi:hypothetical protein
MTIPQWFADVLSESAALDTGDPLTETLGPLDVSRG